METLRREYDLAVELIEGSTQADLNRSCLQDDLVLFDASVEDGHNYAAATSQPMTLDRVLVMSRTYLPLNFYGLREGGAPDFPHRTTQTNEEILNWLRGQIASVVAQRARPDNRKGIFGSFRAMRESLKKREADWKARGRIFISYRSRHLAAVQQLSRRIELGDFHGGRPQTAFFLPPGQLVYENELLTEHRHWQLLSMIDRRIGAADELWVYETDDYYDSWWTRGELVTVAYRQASGIYAPKVRAFHSKQGKVRDLPANFLSPMTSKQKARMARWYANTDPGMMAPESLNTMRFYAQLPLLGRLPYFRDHVWSENFWFVSLLRCDLCGERARGSRPFDLEAFLWLNDPKLVRLSPQQLKEALTGGDIICPGCRTTYKIRQSPDMRYLWIPLRAHSHTDPDGSHLMALPIIRVEP